MKIHFSQSFIRQRKKNYIQSFTKHRNPFFQRESLFSQGEFFFKMGTMSRCIPSKTLFQPTQQVSLL